MAEVDDKYWILAIKTFIVDNKSEAGFIAFVAIPVFDY